MLDTIQQNDTLRRTMFHKMILLQDTVPQNDTLCRTPSHKWYSMYAGHCPTKWSSTQDNVSQNDTFAGHSLLCTFAVCCSVRGHGRGDTALVSWSSRAVTLSSIPSSHDVMSPWLLVNSDHHSRMSWRWPRASLDSSDSLSTDSVRERLTSTTWKRGGERKGERIDIYMYFWRIIITTQRY